MNSMLLRVKGKNNSKMPSKKKKEMEWIKLRAALKYSQELQDELGSGNCIPFLKLLNKCLESTDAIEQASLIKQVGQNIQKIRPEDQTQARLCCKILVEVYLELPLKSIVKKTVASVLQACPDCQHSFISDYLECALTENLKNISDVTNTTDVRHLIDNIIASFDNFPLGEKSLRAAVVSVLQFSGHAMILLMQQLRKTCSPLEATSHYHNLEALVRSIVLILQKAGTSIQSKLASSKRDLVLEILVQILHHILTSLNDDHILLDCRMHCGMAVPLLLKHILGADYYKMILQIAYPKAASEKNMDNEPYNIEEQLEGLPADFDFTLSLLGALPMASQLFLTSGLLSVMDVQDLCVELLPNQCILTDVFLPDLLHISNSNNNSAVAINCAKGLHLWTHRALDVLENCTINKELQQSSLGSDHVSEQLMDYLWSHWEHFIEGIRHISRNIFINFIKFHCLSKEQHIRKSSLVENLIEQLLTMPSHRCSKYSALCCLVDLVSSKHLLECQPSLPQDLLISMEDKAVACYASELFEKLFTSHLSEIHENLPVWQQIWVPPVLTALCQDSKVAELEHILSKLLKSCPEILNFITSISSVEDYPTSVKYLGALIKTLKMAKILGILKPEQRNSSQYWNNILPFSALNQALRHANDEIRLDAFGLLCLSAKSTEIIPLIDLELIGSFLCENLSNQSASFRQQLLANVKKLIIRLRDGGYARRKKASCPKKDLKQDELQNADAVLKYYQDFLNWLSDLQFSCLHLGANFPRRGTALQILALLHENIGFQTTSENQFCLKNSTTFFNVQALLECLRDTYEVNKGLALSVLKDLPPELFGFQNEERLLALFDASLALASSPRPAESVTAAYFLRLLIHFPKTWVIAIATKQFFEEGCQNSQEGSGRATPVLCLKEGDISSAKDYLDQYTETTEHTVHECAMAVLEILLMQLQGEIECAKCSILEAALHAPMYGLLLCIRSVLSEIDLRLVRHDEQWKSLIVTIVEVCFPVGELVQTIVNNASPEGHIPMDTDSESLLQLYSFLQKALGYDVVSSDVLRSKASMDDDDVTLANGISHDMAKLHSITAQMLLLCGWRAIKEISLMLGELCQNTELPTDENADETFLLSWNHVEQIGEYFITQLGEIKHRGAFEQAYAGFCKMCTSLWNSPGKLHELPKQWLFELFSQFQNGIVSPKYCCTRRSAGIPFMVQALVTTVPPINNYSSLHEVMVILLDLSLSAQHAETDAQVHALNILRALFRDMRLGENIIPYIADGVKAAVLGFKSKIWAVCNSSTLLFSALMTRIFGVKRGKDERNRKNCMTGRVFFQRFPSLYEFLLTELMSATKVWDSNQEAAMPNFQALPLHPSLYPILLLLSRLYPSALEGSDSNLKLSAFVPHIRKCSHSPNIKNRSLSAQALVALIVVNSYHIILEQLIAELPNEDSVMISHNSIHGLLLMIQQVFSETSSAPEVVQKKIKDCLGDWLNSKRWICSKNNPCLITRTTFFEVIDTALSRNLITSDHKLIEVVQNEILTEIYESTYEHRSPGNSSFQIIVAKLALNIAIIRTEISYSVEIKWSSSELCELSNAVGGNDFTNQALTPHDPLDLNWGCSENSVVDIENNECLITQLATQLLLSPYYEVRLLVMRWLYLLLQQETFIDFELARDDITTPISIESFHWIYNTRKSQYCIQQLLSSKTVVCTLIDLALSGEQPPDCLTELFHLLCLFPFAIHSPWPHPHDASKSINSFEKLDLLLQRGEVEVRDDLRCALLRFTGCLVPQVYLDLAETSEDSDLQNKTILEEWADAFLLCCSPEQSLTTRTIAAHVLTHVASYFLLDPHHILESTSCMMWCALVRLLLDDDFEIKKKAASVVNIFDSFSHFTEDVSVVTHNVHHVVALDLAIGFFVDNYGEKFQTECLTTLLDWCLREETSEMLSMREEDDRLFDKGEMNIYTEEVTLTNVVVKHLKRLLRRLFGGKKFESENKSLSSAQLGFNVDIPGFQKVEYNREEMTDKFIPESLTSDSLAVLSMPNTVKDAVMSNLAIPTEQLASWLPSADATTMQSESDYLILRDIVSMIIEELNILLSETPTITNKTPFVCRHFERHILRLYRRVMAVTSLSKYDASQKESLMLIEPIVTEKLASTSPYFNRLIYIMLREIKKAICVLSQT